MKLAIISDLSLPVLGYDSLDHQTVLWCNRSDLFNYMKSRPKWSWKGPATILETETGRVSVFQLYIEMIRSSNSRLVQILICPLYVLLRIHNTGVGVVMVKPL